MEQSQYRVGWTDTEAEPEIPAERIEFPITLFLQD
jgi:hypothetical protein